MKRILIVDDEITILSGLSKALHVLCDFEGEVRTISNGKGALFEISRCFYDVCFLDINLCDFNGMDIMKKIKEISPETNIAVMTAEFISDEMKKTMEEDSALLISKPVDFALVQAFLKWALEKDGKSYKSKAVI